MWQIIRPIRNFTQLCLLSFFLQSRLASKLETQNNQRNLGPERQDILAVSFELSERNEKSALEWGYAAVRCAHLET